MAIKNKFDETQTKQLNDALAIQKTVKRLIPMVSLIYIYFNNYRKFYILLH